MARDMRTTSIWPKKKNLYHGASTRLALTKLHQLLQNAAEIDERIKTSQTSSLWYDFERLILEFCHD